MNSRRLHGIGFGLVAVSSLAVLTAGPAAADTGQVLASNVPTYQEWLSSTTDSHGVPLEQYRTLPLDRGDIFTPMRQAVAAVMDLVWGAHFAMATSLLWLLQLLLSFAWVEWIVATISPMAEALERNLSGLNWVALAAGISGMTVGLLFVMGKRSAGWGEAALTTIMITLATGALLNPVTWLTGPEGMLQKAQNAGGQLAVELTGGDSSEIAGSSDAAQVLNQSVVKEFAELLLRMPAQEATFGHALTGECDATFSDKTKAADPLDTSATDVRDAVSKCDEAAKSYVTSDSPTKIVPMLAYNGGVMVVLAVGFFLALIFIVAVLLALALGLWQMVTVLWAILPRSNRIPFLRAFMGVMACLAVIMLATVLTAASINLLVDVLRLTSVYGVIPQMAVLLLFSLATIILLLMMRSAIHRKAKKVADWAARLGLSKKGSDKPGKIQRVAQAFPRHAVDFGRDELNRRLMTRRMAKTVAPAPTPRSTADGARASAPVGSRGAGARPSGAATGTGLVRQQPAGFARGTVGPRPVGPARAGVKALPEGGGGAGLPAPAPAPRPLPPGSGPARVTGRHLPQGQGPDGAAGASKGQSVPAMVARGAQQQPGAKEPVRFIPAKAASPGQKPAGAAHGADDRRRALPASSGPGKTGPVIRGGAGGSGPVRAGKALSLGGVVAAQITPKRARGSVATTALRAAGTGARVLGGPAGFAAGTAAHAVAGHLDQRRGTRRHVIEMNSGGQARVVPRREVIEGRVLAANEGPRFAPRSTPAREAPQRASVSALRERINAAKR